jgi:hypothetical protein
LFESKAAAAGFRGTSHPNIVVGLVCASVNREEEGGEGGECISTLSVVIV